MNDPDSNNGPVELPPESSELPIGLPVEPGVLPSDDLSEIPLAVILEDYKRCRADRNELFRVCVGLNKLIIDFEAKAVTAAAQTPPNKELGFDIQNEIIPPLRQMLKGMESGGGGTADKEVGTRERDGWAKLVKVLCLGAGIDLAHPSTARLQIQCMGASSTVNLTSDRDIEGKLKLARDAN